MGKSIARNLSVKDAVSFSDFYEEISRDWEMRAARLIKERDAKNREEI
jgi:hypothetical protein